MRPIFCEKNGSGNDACAGSRRLVFDSVVVGGEGKSILPLKGKMGLPLDKFTIPTRSHQTVFKRFCLGDLARGIRIIRITLKVLAIVIFVVIVLSRGK